MSRVSPEIAASQAAYAARKWATSVNTRDFAGTCRFHTFREAIDYAKQIKWLSQQNDPRHLNHFWCELGGPGGPFTQEDSQPLISI